jgi:protocatechuate 3,4-dioxygenase beta subunit
MVTNREGEYHFRTLRPVPYTGRTPHIHYRVTADGFDRLTTQLYVAEESERNAVDVLYKRHSKEAQALLTSAFKATAASGSGPVAAGFNIVLG